MTTGAPDPDAFAALLCDWCMEVAPGDRVGILSTTLADDLAAALHRAVLERDAWPLRGLEPPGLAADLYRHAHDRHRTEPPPTAPGGRGRAGRLRPDRGARQHHRAGRRRPRGGRRRWPRRAGRFQEASLKLRWTRHDPARPRRWPSRPR